MLIVASANLLGYVFARERIPQEISECDARPHQQPDGLPAAGLRALDAARHRAGRDRRAHPDGADPAADRAAVRRRPDRARRADDPVPDDRPADAAGRHGDLRPAGDHQGPDGRGLLGVAAVPGAAHAAVLRRSSSGRTRSSTCPRGWGCDRRGAPPVLAHRADRPRRRPVPDAGAARARGGAAGAALRLQGHRPARRRDRPRAPGAAAGAARSSSASTGSTSPIPVKQAMVPLVDEVAPRWPRSARSTPC